MPFTPDQKKEFDSIYAKAIKLKEGNKLVQLMYMMLKLIRESNNGYEVRCPPKQVGIHTKNRSGKKMVGETMQKKGRKIVNVGFRPELCGTDRAIAIEVNPNNKDIENHTIDTTIASPLFAKYERGVIRAGSCGCGHLNQFLAAISSECEVPPAFHGNSDSFGAQGGTKLDKHLLCKSQDSQMTRTYRI